MQPLVNGPSSFRTIPVFLIVSTRPLDNRRNRSASEPVVPRQYWYAFGLVTSLFALWGFANDFTNPLVRVFKDVFLISNLQSSFVQFAFYGGYATMAIPAALVIRRLSFKAGILIGLALYAVGALLTIPASVNMQFSLFLVALYILTFGLAFLETSANPYILAMGPAATATRRLNLAQAFNPVGSLLGMVVASQLILPQLQISEFRAAEMRNHPEYAMLLPSEVDSAVLAAMEQLRANDPVAHQRLQADDLATVRIPYVAITVIVLFVFSLIALSKMPSAGNTDEPIHLGEVLSHLNSFRYIAGVIAQMFYVGAQIMCWTFIIHYGMSLLRMDAAQAQRYNIAAMVVFLISRFVWTYVLKYMRPGLLLGSLAVMGLVLSLGTVFAQGMLGLYCLIGISACMGVMFPTIYGIALSGLSVDDAKLGSAGLIFAIVGGALLPPLQGWIIDFGSTNLFGYPLEAVRASFLLPAVCFVFIAIYGFIVAARPAISTQ